jgi:hypothetical protein
MAEKKREDAGDRQVPPTVAIGREVAARVPGKNPHTGQPQGLLVRNPPGSNGGTHRGPDLKPRSIVRAIYLKALSDPGVIVQDDEKKGSWRHRKKMRHAAVHNGARMIQRVFEDAASGAGGSLRLVRRHDDGEGATAEAAEVGEGHQSLRPRFLVIHAAMKPRSTPATTTATANPMRPSPNRSRSVMSAFLRSSLLAPVSLAIT